MREEKNMHAGNVHKITLDTDENGFELTLHTDTGPWVFNVQAVAEELYDACRVEIRPWLREAAYAKAESHTYATLETLEIRPWLDSDYEITDPKHPRYHSTHADLWDARADK